MDWEITYDEEDDAEVADEKNLLLREDEQKGWMECTLNAAGLSENDDIPQKKRDTNPFTALLNKSKSTSSSSASSSSSSDAQSLVPPLASITTSPSSLLRTDTSRGLTVVGVSSASSASTISIESTLNGTTAGLRTGSPPSSSSSSSGVGLGSGVSSTFKKPTELNVQGASTGGSLAAAAAATAAPSSSGTILVRQPSLSSNDQKSNGGGGGGGGNSVIANNASILAAHGINNHNRNMAARKSCINGHAKPMLVPGRRSSLLQTGQMPPALPLLKNSANNNNTNNNTNNNGNNNNININNINNNNNNNNNTTSNNTTNNTSKTDSETTTRMQDMRRSVSPALTPSISPTSSLSSASAALASPSPPPQSLALPSQVSPPTSPTTHPVKPKFTRRTSSLPAERSPKPIQREYYWTSKTTIEPCELSIVQFTTDESIIIITS
ncbi:hypothetical protein BGZ65_005876 [Modicella reniformis]|uniref:Uncharacterized protein n=1 Tax=Modicella reniformis TaxID=1440133 RepID=A0A9P6MGB3_9FUNG|nr:hypothetical protein BGZ65_005876 [Modicella reniformis]